MADFLNKLIKFPNINIEVKPINILYNTELSSILLCEETKTKAQFCIKIISTKKNDTYQRNIIKTEIELLQKMKNEKNIVQTYDFFYLQKNNHLYCLILMEYCKYHTLLEYIDKNQILDDAKIYSIISQIANGLKSIHKNKYYHRDLRPENILLRNETDKDIEIAICDFGSATNQIYPNNDKFKNTNNTNSINDLLFDLYSKTNIIYRAPEEIFLNSKYPITEKVDIFALGIISVMLLLSYIPPWYFNFHLLLHSSKKIRVKIISEINNLCNPCFAELLDSIFSMDPNQRFSIDEIINFLKIKENQIKPSNQEVIYKKEKNLFNEIYPKTLYEFEEQEMNDNEFSMRILTKRILHGKFLNSEGLYEAPDLCYIDTIIDTIKKEPNQIIEFYNNLFSTNVFFYNIFSLKFEFDLHYLVFNFNNKNTNKFPNNIGIICEKEINIFEKIDNFIKFFDYKANKKYYNKDKIKEEVNEPNIDKFIGFYIKFLRRKIILLKNNPLVISNDNTINSKNPNEIISQNFIFDIWYLFSLSYQLLSLIPFNNTIIPQIFDLISNILNKELVSLGSILLIQLFFLKKKNKNFDFFSKFIETVENSSNILKNLEKYRKEINSKYEVEYLIKDDNSNKKLKTLLNCITNIKYDENFDMNEFFKPDSNLRKKFDFIPIKFTYYEENVFNDNDIFGINQDLNNLNNNNVEKNYLDENNFINFNQNFFPKFIFSKNEKNKEFDLSNINQSDVSSTLLLSNISENSNFDKISNKRVDKNKISNLISEDITYYLISQFSKPMYHFIINPNEIKIFNLIAYGSTSEVYLGDYKGLDVAIKKIKVKDINDNFYKEYQNEISSLTLVRHPNIINFLGTMNEENNLYIITKYCQGGTLYDLLYKKKNIEIPLNLKLKFLIEISKAMNYLHTNEPQIIHHDLKTLNILLTSEISQTNSNEHISIKICDFGLSQIISKDSKTPGLKGIGSVQWMAPETLQVNTADNINEKVDVYSFGIIIWEIWARTQPYKDMDVSQVINYVVNENGRPDLDLIKKEEMPEGLLGLFELMEKCWNKDPNSRPDFSEILETLDGLKIFLE